MSKEVNGRQQYSAQIFNESGYVLMLPSVGETLDILQSAPPPNPYAESETQLYPLGTKLINGERVWRYAKNGAATLAIAVAAQGAAHHADTEDDIASGAASAVGSYEVSLTSSANIVCDANTYKEGYLIANDAGTGEGQMFKIKSHTALAGTAETLFVLYDPIFVVTTTATQWGLRRNPYSGVVVTPGTTPTAMYMGQNQRSRTAAYYFWLQTGGPAPGIAHAAIPIGAAVTAGLTGAKLDPSGHDATYGLLQTDVIIGYALTPAIADTEEFMVFLTQDR